jgi:hypothetical protein
MTSTLRNNLLVHWAIPGARTRSVHTRDNIFLSVDYSPPPIETYAVITRIEEYSNRKTRGPEEPKNLFSQSVRYTSAFMENTLDSSHHESFLCVVEIPPESSPKG